MSNSKGSEDGSKLPGILQVGRSLIERLRLRKGPNIGGKLRTVISWIPLYIMGLYLLDYTETKIGLGIGMQELNPLINNLSNLFGILAFPVAFLIIGVSMYLLAGQYAGYPKLVTGIAIVVGGNETINVSINLISILHKLSLLR